MENAVTPREKCCGKCANFTPLQPDDPTAGEGRCGLKKWPGSWPMGYWPAMLRGDFCAHGFVPKQEAVQT